MSTIVKILLTKTSLSKIPLFVKVLLWDINNIVSSFKFLLPQPLVNFISRISPKVEPNEIMRSSSSSRSSALSGQEFGHEKLDKEEVKTVMKKLGIISYGREHGEDNVPDREVIGKEEILELFDEEEPSLEELKEAFDVFDDNKDGFIDAQELGRVLSKLGLLKESGIIRSECLRNMIKEVDENQDGVVDFNEFVKFMESCFF